MFREALKSVRERVKEYLKIAWENFNEGVPCSSFYDPKTGECTLLGLECFKRKEVKLYQSTCHLLGEFRKVKKEYEHLFSD